MTTPIRDRDTPASMGNVRSVIAIALVVASGLAAFLFLTNDRVREVNNAWSAQNSLFDRKTENLTTLTRSLGYDGFIHHFKNYVLRKEPTYLAAARGKITEAMDAITTLRSLNPTEREAIALDDLQAVIGDLPRLLDMAEKAVAANQSAEEIDRDVRINDPRLTSALLILTETINAEELEALNSTDKAIQQSLRLLFAGLLGIPIIAFAAYVLVRYILRINELSIQIDRHRQQLEQTLQNINQGIVMTDAAMNIVVANDRFYDKLGLDRSESPPGSPLEKCLRHLISARSQDEEATRRAVEQQIARIRGGARIDEVRNFPEGRIIDIKGVPVPGGGYVITLLDITMRLQAEREARQARARLVSAISAIDEAFVYYDAEDRLVMCNDRYRDFYPLSADLLVTGAKFEDIIRAGVARGEYDLGGVDPDTWVRKRMAAHLAANSIIEQQLNDGRWLKISERRTPDGGIVGFRVDVTQLKLAQENAEAANRAKSAFLANMSHEIRTPMNAIIGLSQLALKSDSIERMRDHVGKVNNAARNLMAIINDILDFSKLEAGKMPIENIPFRLDNVMRDVSSLIGDTAARKGLEVVFDVATDVERNLIGDPLRLGQVLTNLVHNAVKFTAEGEVLLRVRRQENAFAIHELVFEVIDTGIGMSEDQLGQLFQSFTQADTSTTRKFGGTGLGLAICRELVEAMGGNISVRSMPGEGSVFKVTLPFGLQAAQTAPHRYVPLASRAIRVLAVSPSPAILYEISKSLTALHINDVECLTDPNAAIELLDVTNAGSHGYDLLLVDIGRKGANDLEVIRRLGHLATGQGAPGMIAIAARPLEDAARRSIGVEPVAVLQKPLHTLHLVEAVFAFLFGTMPDEKDRTSKTDTDETVEPGLEGMHVLVAEDNDLNRQVVGGLLKELGVTTEFAENGRIAVDRVRRGPVNFNLILMDLQMPELDGIAAAREIRALPGGKDVPIVALTAHAMTHERTACEAAGMTGHVSKPIEISELVRTLQRFKGRAPDKAPAPSATPTVSAPQEWPKLPERAGVLELGQAQSRIGLGEAFFWKLLHDFNRKYADLDRIVADHMAKGEIEAVGRLAHSISGLAGTLGAERLQDAARAFEAALRSGGPPPDPSELVAAHREVRKTLDDLLSGLSFEADDQTGKRQPSAAAGR